MLISDLLVEKTTNGAYVACKFTEDSCKKLHDFAKDMGISDVVPDDKMHVTVIYSKKPAPPEFKAEGKFDEPVKVQPKHLSVFDGRDGSKVLVVELNAPSLVERHDYLMDEYSFSYDFPEYKPHVTLCYDMGKGFQLDKDRDLSALQDLEISEEYYKLLETNWNKDKK